MRLFNSTAPVRICDIGGWTDTWFARHGTVFNIAVRPAVEVQVQVSPAAAASPDRIVIHAENHGDRYVWRSPSSAWDRHPLIEACIEYAQVPESLALELTVFSHMPPGASTGTSAAVAVAVLGALDRAAAGGRTPLEIARAAHAVEVQVLGQQSGIQDQLCSALGGIDIIEIDEYPEASVSRVEIPDAVRWELARRLLLVYLGRAHSSSRTHEQVIERLAVLGPEADPLRALRGLARRASDALRAGNLRELGEAMSDNTEVQASLHPGILSPDARQVIEIARAHGAVGWKLNGAGGDGGSVTILCGAPAGARRAIIAAIEVANPSHRHLPVDLSPDGLRVWEVG